MYPNYQYEPQYAQNMFQQRNVMQLVRVNGIEGARAYQMPPNSTAALFDAGSDIMYIKQTDGAGFPSIRIFAFTEQTAQAFKNADNYVTRDEFDEILKVIDQLKGATRYGEQPVSGKK